MPLMGKSKDAEALKKALQKGFEQLAKIVTEKDEEEKKGKDTKKGVIDGIFGPERWPGDGGAGKG